MWLLDWLTCGGKKAIAKVAKGHFAIGHELFPFGSTYIDLEARGIAINCGSSPRRNEVIDVSGNVCGLQYTFVEVFCFAPNRPIEQLWYTLPLDSVAGHLGTIRQGQRRLIQALGRPTTASGHISDICITSEGDVVFDAVWRLKHCLWGVSWFGDVRHQHGNALSGMLYLHWDDEKAAAKPYLPEFRLHVSGLQHIPVPTAISRLRDSDLDRPSIRKWYHVGAASDPASDPSLIEAQRALYSPRLLFTPRKWLRELPIYVGGELVAWKSSDGLLGVSTPHDTWMAELGELPVVDEFLTHPAKGPGSHSVRLGEIEVTVAYTEGGNPEIQEFIAAIKAAVQIEHRHHESSDC
jgi:hypothetical protein